MESINFNYSQKNSKLLDTPRDLTSGRILARNTIWNLIGLGAPLLVAFFAIPLLIKRLGTDRFGVLALAWAVVGYFNLFDPGMGRALTKLVAEKLGISLGKVNYCLSELAAKGWIKVIRFKSAKNKLPYTYMLTPKGLEEKGRLTLRFLRRKLLEYKEIKRQISELYHEVEEDGLDDLGSELSAAVKSII